MKHLMCMFAIGILTIALSGCLYPEERKAKNRVPYEDQLKTVQNAVIQYQKDTGVLPIKNRKQGTLVYIKYPIDFGKLVPRYIAEAPGNSYESGGIFQYVLVDVEKQPKVKLVDLETVEKVKDYRMSLRLFLQKHKYPPYQKVHATGRFTLKHKKLGYKSEPVVKSPFTGKNLPLIVDGNNKVYIDYSIDLYHVLQGSSPTVAPGEDIRSLLVEDSMFVPVYSVPYTVKDGEPVFLLK